MISLPGGTLQLHVLHTVLQWHQLHKTYCFCSLCLDPSCLLCLECSNVPLYLASPASSVRPNVGSSPGESLPGSLGWMSCFPPFSSPLCTSQSLRFTPLFIMTIMRKIIDCELFEGTDGNLFVHLVPNTVLGPWQMVNE